MSNIPPPPPPPPPSGASFGVDPSLQAQDSMEIEQEELKDNAPKVSGAPAKIFIVLGGFVIFALVVAYVIFGEKDKKTEEEEDEKPLAIAKDTDAPSLAPPPAPAPLPPRRPILAEPNAPGLAPPPIIPAPPVSAEQKASDNKDRKARLSSPMLMGSGSSKLGGASDEKDPNDAFSTTDPNLAYANKAIKASKAEQAYATRLKNPSSTIAQGKMINAVLETAINTQLPGQIRAIVSHDIYAESGRARLVPKGSRLIGSYNTSMFKGQSRVYIIWTRIIRPDGIDIMVNSPGTDTLGRAGVQGALDSRYFEIFSSAVLSSLIAIGIADFAENGLGIDTNTSQSTGSDGTTTTSGSASGQATAEAISNITSTSEKIVSDMVDTRSVVTIDQGTPVNVFVNRDLIFPANVVGEEVFVQ